MTREEALQILDTIPTIGEQVDALELAIEVLEQEPCEDCISRAEAQKHIYQRLWESALNNVGYECKAEDVFMDIADNRLSTWISEIPSVQPISKSVIEDIKADIAEFMAKIPALGNCKEGWHNAGQRIGLEQACEIIDNHIAESEE